MFSNLSPQLEAAPEYHFRRDHHEKHHAHERVEPEESHVDPVQAAAARDPVFQREAAENDEPADEIRDAEPAEEPKGQQKSAHDEMRKKRRLKCVFWPPSHNQRMQAVRFVELVIL